VQVAALQRSVQLGDWSPGSRSHHCEHMFAHRVATYAQTLRVAPRRKLRETPLAGHSAPAYARTTASSPVAKGYGPGRPLTIAPTSGRPVGLPTPIGRPAGVRAGPPTLSVAPVSGRSPAGRHWHGRCPPSNHDLGFAGSVRFWRGVRCKQRDRCRLDGEPDPLPRAAAAELAARPTRWDERVSRRCRRALTDRRR
jgi:hypothetical protein